MSEYKMVTFWKMSGVDMRRSLINVSATERGNILKSLCGSDLQKEKRPAIEVGMGIRSHPTEQ
jgi:hypothetical protein